eukprot:SAG22_NODE_1697_length_3790_cov_1.813601_4_plen_64_part_00
MLFWGLTLAQVATACYGNGYMVEKDEAEAAEWWRKANAAGAERDEAEADRWDERAKAAEAAQT